MNREEMLRGLPPILAAQLADDPTQVVRAVAQAWRRLPMLDRLHARDVTTWRDRADRIVAAARANYGPERGRSAKGADAAAPRETAKDRRERATLLEELPVALRSVLASVPLTVVRQVASGLRAEARRQRDARRATDDKKRQRAAVRAESAPERRERRELLSRLPDGVREFGETAPLDLLRALAVQRGVALPADEARALAERMGAPSPGAVRVRYEAGTQTFPVMTAEQAREASKKKAGAA